MGRLNDEEAREVRVLTSKFAEEQGREVYPVEE